MWGMLLGKFKHLIDTKGRLTLPSKFRAKLSKQLYITKGFEGCLELRGQSEFQKYSDKIASLNNTSRKARILIRHIMSESDDPILDKAGRIKISKGLLATVGIKTEVTIIGCINRIEIWDSFNLDKYLKATEEEFEDIADLLNESERL